MQNFDFCLLNLNRLISVIGEPKQPVQYNNFVVDVNYNVYKARCKGYKQFKFYNITMICWR